MMPIADGKEFIRGVRALDEYRNTPLVMMSSSPKQVALAAGSGREIEVSAFLAKPFMVEDLLDLVERLIGKADEGTGRQVRH